MDRHAARPDSERAGLIDRRAEGVDDAPLPRRRRRDADAVHHRGAGAEPDVGRRRERLDDDAVGVDAHDLAVAAIAAQPDAIAQRREGRETAHAIGGRRDLGDGA